MCAGVLNTNCCSALSVLLRKKIKIGYWFLFGDLLRKRSLRHRQSGESEGRMCQSSPQVQGQAFGFPFFDPVNSSVHVPHQFLRWVGAGTAYLETAVQLRL